MTNRISRHAFHLLTGSLPVMLLAGLIVPSVSAAPITTVTIATGLNRPVWAGSTPALPNHLFIAEKQGIIRVIDMANSNTVSQFMNIDQDSDICWTPSSGSDEQGLLGVAFHPDYANNRLFYVYHTTSNGVSNVIARYQANVGLLTADPSTRLVMVTMPNVENNHNGGCMKFGPDGKLYVGCGDGGGANDQHGTIGNAQSFTTYLGKMLRMDVDIASPYVPGDNPNLGGSGVDLKWMYGLRNPWRFSFDRGTGDLYIGDVGQGSREEIDYVPVGTGAGRNFGWRCMEGDQCTPGCANCSSSGPNCTCGSGALTNPVLVYPRTQGICVTGGYVYRGVQIPGENGNYFYGDYSSGRIWSFKIVGGAATGNTQRLTFSALTSFGEDVQGELYLVNGTGTATGTIRRIVPLNNNRADINADGAKDTLDTDILANVLLEIDVGDPALVWRSDVNRDGSANGLDIKAWVDQPFP